MAEKLKTCRVCKEDFGEKTGFYPSRAKRYDWICKDCSGVKQKDWRNNKKGEDDNEGVPVLPK